MNSCTILVIEDDSSIRRGLVDALQYAGYRVIECGNGDAAAKLAIESDIDLALLDVMLPGKDAFSIRDEVRSSKPTLPVIMVTARGAEKDRVLGLTHGADDYIIKPFSALELLARVEAVLRRSPARPMAVRMLRHAGSTVDLDRREMMHADGTVHELSEREAAILTYLAANHARTVDRRELLQHVWGLDPNGLETRTVDMHIARLREKLGDESADGSSQTSVIQTVRGKGYKLAPGVHVQ